MFIGSVLVRLSLVIKSPNFDCCVYAGRCLQPEAAEQRRHIHAKLCSYNSFCRIYYFCNNSSLISAAMARLNEDAVQADSVDDVKREEARKHAKDREWMRELIRKNRQLVEDNKVKSLTIRGLNDEVARLRAQNLVLREDVMKLRLELRKKPSQERVHSVSDSLRQKLEALQEVLVELDMLQEPQLADEPETPVREWKREQRARITIQDDPSRLPTIREGKSYPRHSDSPGTPPVTSLDPEELVGEEGESSNQISEAGAVNLETRRKRRDSGQKLDIKRIPIFQSPPNEEKQQELAEPRKSAALLKTSEDFAIPKTRKLANPVRAGSKRKISPLEEDSVSLKQSTNATEEPQVSQTSEQLCSSPKTSAIRAQNPLIRPRQVLATKSTNNSPIAISEKKRALKDTPPPITNSVMDGAPTLVPTRVRRSRPTVNYAEPNLVSKMRRPSSTLLDAVGPEDKGGSDKEQTELAGSRSIPRDEILKKMSRSSDELGGALSLPVSPLDDKSAGRSKVLERIDSVAREKTETTERKSTAGATGTKQPQVTTQRSTKVPTGARRKSALV